MLPKSLKNALSLTALLFIGMFVTACDKNDAGIGLDELSETYDLTARSPETAEVCNWVAQLTGGDLEPIEEEAIKFMREEEKLARDAYRTLFDKWGVNPFRNIANAEQRHMDAILCLIDKYGLMDPVTIDAAGVFENEELTDLYETLMTQGNESVIEAYKVGAMIEITDILDLRERIGQTDNPDIQAVFNELERGSRNHLRAFARNLENLGVEFDPAPMEEADYRAIVESDMEKGGNICGNPGNSKGNSKGKGKDKGKGKGKGKGDCMEDGNGPGKGNGKGFKNQQSSQKTDGLRPCDGTGKGYKGGHNGQDGKGNGNKGNGKGGNNSGGNGNGGG